MFVMNGIYKSLAAMSTDVLQNLANELKFHPDPWAVGARKLIAHELWSARHDGYWRNKIYSF